MTTPVPAVPPPPEDLAARVFRALYPEFDLHDLDLPKGTPCFTAAAIGEIARQISGHEHHVTDPRDAPDHPDLPRRL